ncbi:MAG: DUF6328 family protein [Solirubrobacteraceae bacterium]
MTEERDRTERQMAELLQEMRIALPGVQFLFAFLLTVPFAARFQNVTSFQRTAYFVALMFTAGSAVFLIAVPATHRLLFQQGDRPYIIRNANRYLIVSLVLLAIGMLSALVSLTDFLYGGAATWVWPGLIAALLSVLWFVRPLLRRR